ncbi:MAG TPA: hypothetical protein ENK58_05580 [Desulfobacterales bacterium]|nr:hypothetical protein [Desulfobacterales bacterium]
MIQSLHLRNFKCFEEQTFTFAPLTLLSGLNGMGKSSLLQALLLLRQSYHQRLLPDTGLALNGDLVNIGTARDALYENAEEDSIGFDLRWANGSASQWNFEYNREADILNLTASVVLNSASASVSPDIFDHSLLGDDFQYLHAERLGPRVSSEKSDFQVRQHRQLGTRGEYAIDFLATFGRQIKPLKGMLHPKAVSDDLFGQTEAWLGEVNPGTRLLFAELPGTDLISLRYSFGTGRSVSSDYRATNTGFGLTYTLPVLLAILAAKSGALLLFENPESHLHPKGQTEIEDQYILSEFSHNGKFSSGLGIAYLLDALALSLNSDPKWNESQIHLQTNGNAVTTYHASSPNHVRENADWIREQREKDDPWLKHGLPRNGRCPYLPPKRYYSEKLADFPTERYSDDRRGFKDRKKQLWLWHKEEQHWDVQFKPYGRGNYFRVTPDGRFLDQ